MGCFASDAEPGGPTGTSSNQAAGQAQAGADQRITQHGGRHLGWMADARQGLADIAAGRTCAADAAMARLQQRRAAAPRAAHTGQTTKHRG
jgi:hypothetical protein